MIHDIAGCGEMQPNNKKDQENDFVMFWTERVGFPKGVKWKVVVYTDLLDLKSSIDKIYQNLLQPFLFTVKSWRQPGTKEKTTYK